MSTLYDVRTLIILLTVLLAGATGARATHSAPSQPAQTQETGLPIGRDTFRIAVSKDGIYEVTGAQLAGKGLVLNEVNPATLEMLHRGEPVAYEFVDRDGNGAFDADDAVRFYGWANDHGRGETLYTGRDNIFWLWSGGTPTTLSVRPNLAGQGLSAVDTFRETITVEHDNEPFSAWGINWDDAPNEPDNFYWAFFSQPDNQQLPFDLALPNPAEGGDNAQITVEVTAANDPNGGQPLDFRVAGSVNDRPDSFEESWTGARNINLMLDVPAAELASTSVIIHLTFDMQAAANRTTKPNEGLYLNRITAEYNRNLTARDNELIFHGRSPAEFQLSGLTTRDPDSLLVWDITNPRQPVAIEGVTPATTTPIGTAVGEQFIVTVVDNIRTLKPNQIARYRPTSIEPSGGHVDWLAITDAAFAGPVNQLAAHREGQGLATTVVDIHDIVNQFGYGFNTPAAIQAYLRHTTPAYVLLVGDATVNPRQLPCKAACPANYPWDHSEETFIVTHLSFTGRFQGLVPSDYPYTLLDNDLIPDLALGRLPATTAVNAQTMVDKILRFEAAEGEPWRSSTLFVADYDGTAFCEENAKVGTLLPGQSLGQQHLCMTETSEAAPFRQELSQIINGPGVGILNYRGHGSVTTWGKQARFLSTDNKDFWLNNFKPPIILSADCLDGHFAWPGISGLGETFLREVTHGGSVAHWSSSGFGYTSEHTVLHAGFYEGVFKHNLVRIGDAVNHAKTVYTQSNQHRSELYSFILLADPAMPVVEPQLDRMYIPLVSGK